MGDNKFSKSPLGPRQHRENCLSLSKHTANHQHNATGSMFSSGICCLICRTVQHLTGGSLQDVDQFYLSACSFTPGENDQTNMTPYTGVTVSFIGSSRYCLFVWQATPSAPDQNRNLNKAIQIIPGLKMSCFLFSASKIHRQKFTFLWIFAFNHCSSAGPPAMLLNMTLML